MTTTTATTTRPTMDTMIARLRTEIERGIKLNFNYTNAEGVSKTVAAFTPESIREINGDVLVVGLNSEGQYRSYYIGRMAGARVAN